MADHHHISWTDHQIKAHMYMYNVMLLIKPHKGDSSRRTRASSPNIDKISVSPSDVVRKRTMPCRLKAIGTSWTESYLLSPKSREGCWSWHWYARCWHEKTCKEHVHYTCAVISFLSLICLVSHRWGWGHHIGMEPNLHVHVLLYELTLLHVHV